MDAPQPPHMTAAAWLVLGIFAFIVWCVGAVFFDGGGTLGLIGAPAFVLLYIAAIVVVDRWVTLGRRFFERLR
jgi:hypothetical protein